METWDIVLLVAAGYVATYGLTRLMSRRRDELLEQFREQMEQHAANSGGEEEQLPPSDKRQAA